MVVDTMYMTGGTINAAGKGYFPIARNYGAGGAGGLNDTNQNEQGEDTGVAAHIFCRVAPVPPDSVRYYGGLGKRGTLADSIASRGQQGAWTTGPNVQYPYGAAFPSIAGFGEMIMGSAGNYKYGHKGANGGDGAGRGGKGGNSADGNPGMYGELGTDGGAGGYAGRSGRGGGIIMLKCKFLSIHVAYIANAQIDHYIYVNGENGQVGGIGGDGGIGGRGGVGGIGKMAGGKIYQNGNQGGHGSHGQGGRGGDGGDGGDCGSVMILTYDDIDWPNISGYVLPPYDDWYLLNYLVTNRNDGKAGYGGRGGENTTKYTRFKDSNFALDTPYYWDCSTGGGGSIVKNVCDCDKAMEFFPDLQSFQPQTIGPPYIRWASGLSGVIDTFIYYGWSGSSLCYRMERRVRDSNGAGVNYHCRMRGNDCSRFFDDLTSGQRTRNGSKLWPENSDKKGFQIRFWDDKDSAAQYYHTYNHEWVINTGGGIDICTQWKCGPANFTKDSNDHSKYGPDGDMGRSTSRPQYLPRSGTGTELKIKNRAPEPIGLKTERVWAVETKVVATKETILVMFQTQCPAETEITLLDISGKEMYRNNLTNPTSLISIPTGNFASGIYLLSLHNAGLGRITTKVQIP